MKENRIASFIVVIAVYAITTILGIVLYNHLNYSFYLNLLIADVACTVMIFIFSLIFKNASMYDPYWSYAPMVMVCYAGLTSPLNAPRVLAIIACLVWGVRLTLNWAYTFKGLNWEDWRYRMLRDKTNKFYPFINFLGIHLFPTIVVYLCMLPAVFMFEYEVKLNALVIVFFTFSLLCPLLQLVADHQMHQFRKENTNTFIRIGLWKNSRHPNYLGEILMWWNIALLAIASMGKFYFLIIGAFANTLMFLFISIPMAENHQKSRKPGFDEYKRQTRMLIPIRKFKTREIEEQNI